MYLIFQKLTSGCELKSFTNNAILDVASLSNHRSFTQETPNNVAAFLDSYLVHDDAVGKFDLFFNLAVGSNCRVLERGLARDVATYTYETLSANLGKTKKVEFSTMYS